MKKRIYYFGNPIVSRDARVVSMIPRLQNHFPFLDFIHVDPTEGITDSEHVVFLDVVLGIKTATVFESATLFKTSPRVTVHDYDVLLDIVLLQKLKKIHSFTLIGVPEKSTVDDVVSVLTPIVS